MRVLSPSASEDGAARRVMPRTRVSRLRLQSSLGRCSRVPQALQRRSGESGAPSHRLETTTHTTARDSSDDENRKATKKP